MDEITRTVPATLDYLMGWLQGYVQEHRLNADWRDGWRVEVEPRHNFIHQGVTRQNAKITGILAGSTVRMPLVEVDAAERQRACTVTLRCNEAALAVWFQGVRAAIAEKWPEGGETGETATAEATALPDPSVIGGRYGGDRDLTIDDVRAIVRRCREFTKQGGKIPEFYRRERLGMTERGFYELDTLRGWLKNPKFKD